jgi:hypothetical protein
VRLPAFFMEGVEMKIALLIVNQVKEIVLTPETEEEKAILKIFGTNVDTTIHKGGFYFSTCKGGWLRQFEHEESVIIQAKDEPTPPAAAPGNES